jgi:hypothetical protein
MSRAMSIRSDIRPGELAGEQFLRPHRGLRIADRATRGAELARRASLVDPVEARRHD